MAIRLSCCFLAVLSGGFFLEAAEPLRIAVLDPGKSDRVPLLEGKLAAIPGIALVERAAIDAILKEQQLQAAFGPKGVGDRVRLGQVLKADLLVLIRSARAEKDPVLEVVVSETAGGLRISNGSIALGEASSDSDRLLAIVNAAVNKSRQKVVEIVAVPAFLSRNLTFDHEHLKGAYARLLEQTVLGQDGIWLVELEEARAVAAELAVAAPGSRVARPLPLYLLGDFRHDGLGADLRVTLRLRAERGGQPVSKPKELVIPPSAVAAALRSWTTEALAIPAAQNAIRTDTRTEYEAILARAAEFRRLGAWLEALSLYDAALLLDDRSLEVRGQAISSIGYAIPQSARKDVEGAQTAQRLYRHGLAHLEAAIDRCTDGKQYSAADLSFSAIKFFASGARLSPNGSLPPEVAAILRDIEQERCEVALRLFRKTVRWPASVSSSFIHHLMPPLPREEKVALIEKLILETRDAANLKPRAKMLLYHIMDDPGIPNDKAEVAANTRARHALYQRLEATGDPILRDAVAEMRKEENTEFIVIPQAPKNQEAGVKLHPIPFRDEAGNAVTDVLGLDRISDSLDFVWGRSGLYLSKARGSLKTLWKPMRAPMSFRTSCFDGQHVWAYLQPYQESARLVVIDPLAETVVVVGEEHGLPQPAKESRSTGLTVAMTTLEKGRIVMVGTFGRT